MEKNKSVEVFMDGVDFQHEIGHASGGNKVYASLGDLLENNPCAKSCGAVKVKVEFVEWVMEQNWNNTELTEYSAEEIEKDRDLQMLEGAMAHLKYLTEKLEKQNNKVEALRN